MTEPPPQPAPRRLWLRRTAIALPLAFLALLLAGFGAAYWLLRSESGTAWLLPQLPGIETRGAKGALWGTFSAEHVVILLPDAAAL